MNVILQGQTLSQQQLDAIAPVLGQAMNGRIKGKKFEQACVDAMAKAGCPLRSSVTPAMRTAALDLYLALEALFDSYKQLADSGDAGNWRIEDEPEGQQALAALTKARGSAGGEKE